MKKRLDLLMMGVLAPSREMQQKHILWREMFMCGWPEEDRNIGTMFQETVKIEVRGNTLPYVNKRSGNWKRR